MSTEDQIMMITLYGKIIRMRVKGISVFRRSSQGVRLIELDEEDNVLCGAYYIYITKKE